MKKNSPNHPDSISRYPLPYIILETANFHGGNIVELERAISTFSRLNYAGLGMKFHAFYPDNVALSDFSSYEISKQFFLKEEEWTGVINLARGKEFDVWLDLFCVYGVQILRDHLPTIFGVKLQPSILDNFEVIDELKHLTLNEVELILNISGLDLLSIAKNLRKFDLLNFKKVVLQMGFQNYPTTADDSSLSKIDILKSEFPHIPLSYADHTDSQTDFAKRFSVYAYLKGCTYLEKHICNDREKTRFDSESALEFQEIQHMVEDIRQVHRCLSTKFILENEKKYLEKTYQKPILIHSLNKGQLIGNTDIVSRRTEKPGLRLREWKDLQENFCVLRNDKNKGDTLCHEDFQKSRIAVLVAVRMKSSRLAEKALLSIHGISSIERCLRNCLKFPHVEEVVLTTSNEENDDILTKKTCGGKVRIWRGDPIDVLARYLGACDAYRIDTVIRVTGDCPVVSPEIAGFLLESHFKNGADFTQPRRFAVGSNCEVYNTEALRRVNHLVGRAEYSEHMSLYMVNNPDIFKVNRINLPGEWIRDYRLTLDYEEDLEMFNALFEKLEEEHLDPTLVNIFKVLDTYPSIPKINMHKTLVYETDRKLMKRLKEKTRIKIE